MEQLLLAGRKILVVEDEMMILLMMEDMLADLGASMSSAATIVQALALIEAQFFDVALLDVNLNGEKSYPVADLLAARGVPFIFATGYGDLSMRDDYRDRPILKKPYRFVKLAEALQAAIAERVV